MSDKNQSQASNLDYWRGNPNFGPVLPPLFRRSSREEEALRQVVRKDLEGFCPAPSATQSVRPPYKLGYEPGSYLKPWRFSPTTDGAAGPLLGEQTPREHQNTMLSSDGFATDASHIETEGDPQQVAKEAEQRPANELIKQEEKKEDEDETHDPEVTTSAKSKVESEEGYERSRTTYEDGSTESKKGHTSTYKETGKPIKGKYEAGSNLDQKFYDESYKVLEDKDGFAQGKMSVFNASSKATVGYTGSDDWVGGNANITAKAGVSGAVSLIEGEGTLNNDGLLNAKGGFEVGKLEGALEAGIKVGTYNGSPTFVTTGKAGIDATLGQINGGVGVSVTPARAINFVVHSFNGVAEWAEWDTRLDKVGKEWDWGFFVEIGGEASIGGALAVEGEMGDLEDGKVGARLKGKAAFGPGAGIKAGFGLQTPEK